MKKHVKTIGLIALVLSVVCAKIYLQIVEKSTLIGDAKGGNYGDPLQAMDVEGQAFPFLLLSPTLLCVSINMIFELPIWARVVSSLILFFGTIFALFTTSMNM